MPNPIMIFSPLRNAIPAQGGAVDLLLRLQAQIGLLTCTKNTRLNVFLW